MKHFQYYTPIVLQKIGYVFFFILYKTFVQIQIVGSEHIEESLQSGNSIILASNHTSELDVTALPLVLSFFSSAYPIYFVSNMTQKYKTFGWRSYFYGGFFFNMLGGYAVHSGSNDYGIALEDHVKLLTQERPRTLWIAPEGKRTRNGNMNPARGGLGYLVHTTNACVIPIAIETFFNISFTDFLRFHRKVILTVGKPFCKEELFTTSTPSVDDYQHAGQIVLDRIKQIMA